MFGFLKSKRPVRPAPALRSFLRIEELGDRAMPSDLLGTTPPEPPPPPPGIENPPPVQAAPFINTFIAAEAAHGWWTLSGHVNGTNANGLIVRFDGVPGVDNVTTTVDANGNFSVTIPVATDGSDRGTISAQTTQNGVDSNLAFTFMDPTP
jgi:hypothetical protein